ncbi:MAG: caspase family protein [Flavobacteriales bacterium]|nr:caspase family protein [Flavobacteriales bacterium]
MKFKLLFVLALIMQQTFSQLEIVVNKGHTGMINNISYSSDGKWQATSGVDKQLILWDYAQRKVYRSFKSTRDVYDIRISEPFIGALYSDSLEVWNFYNGDRVFYGDASGSLNNFILEKSQIIYNNKAGHTVLFDLNAKNIIKMNSSGMRMAISGDRELIITYEILKKQIEILDENLNLIKTIPSEYVVQIDYDPIKKAALIQKTDGAYYMDCKNFSLKKLPEKPLSPLAFDFYDGKLCFLKGMAVEIVGVPKFNKINSIPFSMQPMGVALHPTKKILATGERNGSWEYDLKTGEALYQFENNIHPVIDMAISQDRKYLALTSEVGGFGTKIWNVKKNNMEYTFKDLRYPININPMGELLAPSVNGLNQVCKYNIRFKELKGCMALEKIAMNSVFSENGKIYIHASFNNSRSGVEVHFKDLESRKLIGKFDVPGLGALVMDVTPDGNILAINTTEGLYWVNLKKKSVTKSSITFNWIFSLEFQSNEVLYAAGIDRIAKIDVLADKEMGTLKTPSGGRLEKLCLNDKYVMASINVFNDNRNEYAKIWENDIEKCTFDAHATGIYDALFIEPKNRFYTASGDGSIGINDLEECEPIARLLPFGTENDFILTTEDNYYMASKKALNAISFRHKGQLIPFEQFDLILNRPDIVAQRLNNSSSSLIQAYRRAYGRRIKKMGFSADQLSLDLQLPYIKINQFQEFVTEKDQIELKLTVGDSTNRLNRLMVYSNGVPLDGIKGKPLNDIKTNGKDMTYSVPLVPGKNHIEVSVLNDKGVESIPRSVDVIRKTEEDQNLYLITIGVSDYKNDTFDLDYPVKDAQDLKKFFEQNQGLYDNIYQKELLDSDVTREKLNELGFFLKDVQINDVVIIFVAGHGLLDENYNYYFGTHDMDFNDPALRGLSIEWLEQLMDRIKALKKILFLDTCHSGEVEEDEVEIGDDDLAMLDNVKIRAAGVGIRKKKGLGLFNSVELMQVLFADLRKGTGATILSSAGGAEYAYESAEWKNGLFTYCLLEGLKSKSADLNKDGNIDIDELKSYVSDKVDKLSAGKQKPTSRSENIHGNFRIW